MQAHHHAGGGEHRACLSKANARPKQSLVHVFVKAHDSSRQAFEWHTVETNMFDCNTSVAFVKKAVPVHVSAQQRPAIFATTSCFAASSCNKRSTIQTKAQQLTSFHQHLITTSSFFYSASTARQRCAIRHLGCDACPITLATPGDR